MSSYKYYNRNPQQIETEDCVCRAISTATGLKYEAVNKLLALTADWFCCEKLCVCCYHNLLEDVLYYSPHYCLNNETVGDIANKYPDKKVIIRIQGHLTASIYSVIMDIWDCTDKRADVYWIVE